MSPPIARLLGLRCEPCQTLHPAAPFHARCPRCGGNLWVELDLDAIRGRWTPAHLAQDAERSLWRYAPLLPVTGRLPGPPVGGTPLVEAPRLAAALGVAQLWLKDEGRNPSASLKDRASALALQHARELGATVVCGASTGNAASSTATLASALGLRCVIFIPAAAPQAKVAQLLAHGAQVLAVEGSYDQAFDLCQEASARFGWYNRNTGSNPITREGKKTVALELCEQLGWRAPDLVAVPVGDGNIISGVYKGLSELQQLGFIDRLPRLLAVQAEGSAAIVQALHGDGTITPVQAATLADSISVDLPRDGAAALRAVQGSQGFGVTVSDAEILQAILELARGAGVFGEPAAAAAFAGLKKAAAEGLLEKDARIVALVTGSGLKDVAAALKATGQPTRIAPDMEALERALGER